LQTDDRRNSRCRQDGKGKDDPSEGLRSAEYGSAIEKGEAAIHCQSEAISEYVLSDKGSRVSHREH